MPEVSNYTYNLREVGEILLKKAEIKEGNWIIGIGFAVNIGNMGDREQNAKPGVMALVETINLTKAPDSAPNSGLVIDASKL